MQVFALYIKQYCEKLTKYFSKKSYDHKRSSSLTQQLHQAWIPNLEACWQCCVPV